MSEAVICDRCKIAFAKQNATRVELRRSYETKWFDLCPICRTELEKFMWQNKDGRNNQDGI